ncbi:MAG: hypothetical protein NTAFB05_08010 [Nitrobacter sp.]
MFAALEFRLQYFDRATKRAPFQLNKTPIERNATIHGREEAECAFAPYVCRLYCRAVLQNGQQREDGALWEVGMFEEPTSLADDDTKLELDRLKVGIDPLAAGAFHCAEQPIALRIICVTFGHRGIVTILASYGSSARPAIGC